MRLNKLKFRFLVIENRGLHVQVDQNLKNYNTLQYATQKKGRQGNVLLANSIVLILIVSNIITTHFIFRETDIS